MHSEISSGVVMKGSASNTLVVDLGNSTVSMALFENGSVKDHWKIPSVDLQTARDFERAISESLPSQKGEIALNNIVLSSVVILKTENLEKALQTLFHGVVIHKVAVSVKSMLINGPVPLELGTDLYANAIEARFKKPDQPTIVVDFGTALTFIMTDESGVIKGVSIAPGVKTSLRSLYQVAPALEGYPLSLPLSSLGENTEEAINAGVFYTVSGAVKEVIAQMEKETGKKAYRIATGGHSSLFAPFVGIFDEIDSLHTIKGMYTLFNF